MTSEKAHIDAANDLESLSCISCRARKLKCDRSRGACQRCVKAETECVYPESRRKPAFKRKNVRELEARLAQVEDYLKEVGKGNEGNSEEAQALPQGADDCPIENMTFSMGFSTDVFPDNQAPNTGQDGEMPSFEGTTSDPMDCELIGLGLSESLPPFPVMEELINTYFQVAHHVIPIIHPGRYYQSFYGAVSRKSPLCLQYAVMAFGAHMNPKYTKHTDIFYQRARKYADGDEMKGSGEHFITVAHAQTWAIIASLEAKLLLFTRAAMSSAKCTRLTHMMGLDRLDIDDVEIAPALGPATSWAETEERRRVFWAAFTIDAHASISAGWPSLINTDEVFTRLPSSEDAFLADREEDSVFLEEALKGAPYAGFAGTIVICQIFKAIMSHTHRKRPSDDPKNLAATSGFWARHHDLDNRLSGVFTSLPDNLRLPQNAKDPIAIHTNLNLHASVICLHHAAVEMVDKYQLPAYVKNNSLGRLRTAAREVVNIVRSSSTHTIVFKSPLCALSLYAAASVYIYLAKDDPVNGLSPQDLVSLTVLSQAMEAIARTHYITKAFLQQVCLDVERNNLTGLINLPAILKHRNLINVPHRNIPLLVRGSVAKHTEISSVLPGRLPLDKPIGEIPPSGEFDCVPVETEPSLLSGFGPMLGAVSRNMGGGAAATGLGNHKRKRVSPSPASSTSNMSGGTGFNRGITNQYSTKPGHTDFSGVAGGMKRPMGGVPTMILPDRTGSSTSSSPAHNGTGTDTLSASSHTSPSTNIGLGNSLEENRFDFRAFQDRSAMGMWPPLDTDFLNQITGSTAEESTTWGILSGDIDWSASMMNNDFGMNK